MNYLKFSKEVSYALRHAPWEYELELDENGFVSIEQLLNSLNSLNEYGREIKKEDLEYIIDNSDKKRHEIVGDKIRALYGHSVPIKIEKTIATPPDVLYHGTAKKFLDSIMKEGLLPMNRQYVHLSVDTDMATLVGKRRDVDPVILEINARAAENDGIKFYIGNDKVWLCDGMPSKYIKILKK
jgi:putative RNA 2'-phosphotransferase